MVVEGHLQTEREQSDASHGGSSRASGGASPFCFTYTHFMARRIAAIFFLAIGVYVAVVGINIGAMILRSLLGGPWLGLEPEILIPIGVCLIAILLLWMGMKLWRQDEHG